MIRFLEVKLIDINGRSELLDRSSEVDHDIAQKQSPLDSIRYDYCLMMAPYCVMLVLSNYRASVFPSFFVRFSVRRGMIRFVLLSFFWGAPILLMGQGMSDPLHLGLEFQFVNVSHERDDFTRQGLLGATYQDMDLATGTTSFGLEGSISLAIFSCLRISAGLGYQSIVIRGLAGLDQSRLPADRRSFTKELVWVHRSNYHLARLPLKFLFDPFARNRVRPVIYLGASGSYYFSSYYSSRSKYAVQVPKNKFAGWSSLLGFEIYYGLGPRFAIKLGYEWCLRNPNYHDDLLFRQSPDGLGTAERGIALVHQYRMLKLGINYVLSKITSRHSSSR